MSTIIRENMKHMINSRRCKEHTVCVNRGLSCSVDSLLDVYYYSIYWNFQVNEHANELVRLLNCACKERDRGVSDMCTIRLPVWNWCVTNIPDAFSPQGRDDAEVLSSFHVLGKQNEFTPFNHYMGTQACTCTHNPTFPIPISVTELEKVQGRVSDAVTVELKQSYCSGCQSSFQTNNLKMPPVLMLELGLIDAKNLQKPPLVVAEHITCNAVSYELTGAVLLRPGHYFSIVKIGSVFYVLDDLRQNVEPYSCFTGAVTGDASLHEDFHVTSSATAGIHLLIYVEKTRVTAGTPVFPIMPNPQPSVANTSLHFRPQACSTPVSSVCKSVANKMTGSVSAIFNETATDTTNTSPVSPATMSMPQKSSTPISSVSSSSNEISHNTSISTVATEEARTDRNSVMVDNFLSTFTGDVTNVHIANVSVQMIHFKGLYSIPCQQIFTMTMHLAKRKQRYGFKHVDKHLAGVHMDREEHFIFDSPFSDNERRKRLFLSIPATISYLSSLNDDASLILCGEIQRVYSQVQQLSATDLKVKVSMVPDTSPAKLAKGVLHVNAFQVRFKVVSAHVYLSTPDVIRMMDLETEIKNSGYRTMDAALKRHGIQPRSVFIFEGQQRAYFNADIFHILMEMPLFKKRQDIGEEFLSVLFAELGNSLSTLKKISTPKRKTLKTNIVPVTTPKRPRVGQLRKKNERRQIMKKWQRNVGSKLIKSCLYDLFSTQFQGNTEAFLQAFAGVVSKSSKDEFDGTLSLEQLSSALESRVEKKTNKSFLEKMVVDSAPKVYKMTPLDVTNISQNHSGVRLVEKFRQRLPGVFPSQRAELRAKRELKQDFSAFLLPRRTACGWMIDVSRLMDLLNLKYYYLGDSMKHWKLYGDGREIGGRMSTFVGMSILNTETALRGIKFQSPKIVHPFHIFYESDSRDNLEENLGCPAISNEHFKTVTDNNTFYLSGDEMFLEAVLDGSGKLSPTSEAGWNLYSETDKKSKSNVSNGFRSDCNHHIDRQHHETLFDVVPTDHTVLCLLHAATRITEKLLFLEVLNILSEANKIEERSGNGSTYKITAIANLEDNINRRGVRQGNFRIHFKVSGAPEAISLNKDHAVAILQPHCEDFPHVLHKVLSNTKVNVSLPEHVKARLHIQDSYSQFDFVALLWESFRQMYTILRKDVPEDVTEEELDNLSLPYSDEDVTQYKEQAERFYQLFCFRHTADALTPYMIKLIDHVPELMKTLPFPIARFQSEGGEHLNYDHNKFYFRQTTRHGGKNRPDPMLALLRHDWNNIYYDLSSFTMSSDEQERSVGQEFVAACTAHTAATTIQRFMKGYIVRKKLSKLGWKSYLTLSDPLKATILSTFGIQKCDSTNAQKLLSGKSFFLAGNLQNKNRKPVTHNTLREIIVKNGGKVKGSISCNVKGLSTKQCTVICSDKTLTDKKVPAAIFQALRRGWPIARVAYIYECVSNTKPIALTPFLLNTKPLSCKVTKPVSLVKKHFSRAISLTSRLKLKEKKRNKWEKKSAKQFCRNAAQYYVANKVRSRNQKLHMQEHRQSVSKYFQEWRHLSITEKLQVKMEWRKSGKYNVD